MSFKKITLVVLGMLIIIISSAVVWLQSAHFSSHLTKKIEKSFLKEKGVTLSWDKISADLFPPALVLENLKVNYVNQEQKLAVNIQEFKYLIDPIELIEKRLSLGQLKLSEGYVQIISTSKEELEQIKNDQIDLVFNYQKFLPFIVDTLNVENVLISYNDFDLSIRNAKVYKKWNKFFINSDLYDINKNEKKQIDELWLSGELTKNKFKVNKLKIQDGVSTISFNGIIKNYGKLKGASAKFEGLGDIKLGDYLNEYEGQIQTRFKIKYENELKLKARIDGEDISRRGYLIKKINADLDYTKEELLVSHLHLEQGLNQTADLRRPTRINNITDLKQMSFDLDFNLKKMSLGTVLNIVGLDFSLLDANLSGDGSLIYSPMVISVIAKTDIAVDKFILKQEKEMVRINQGVLRGFNLSVSEKFKINSQIILRNSDIDFKMLSEKEKFELLLNSDKIDLHDFNNILGLDLKGKGKFEFEFIRNKMASNIQVNSNLMSTELLKHKLGDTDTQVNIDLKSGDILLQKAEASFGKRKIYATGVLNFINNDIALGINTNEIFSYELFDILEPYIGDIRKDLDKVKFKAKIDADIYGKISPGKIKLRAHNNLKGISIYDEIFDSGKLNFIINDNLIQFRDIYFNKKQGLIVGDINYNLKNKDTEIDLEIDNLSIPSLNIFQNSSLALDGYISGYLKGLIGNHNNLDSGFNINDIQINHQSMPNSEINFKLKGDRAFGDLNIFGKQITTKFNFGFPHFNRSEIVGQISSEDFKPVLVLILGDSIQRREVKTSLYSDFNLKFDNKFYPRDIILNVSKFNLKTDDFNVEFIKKPTEIRIQDYDIKKWDIITDDDDFKLSSKASGRIDTGFNLKTTMNVDAKLIEVLNKKILSATGQVKISHELEGNISRFDQRVSLASENLGFTIDDVPIGVSKSEIDLSLAKNKLQIKKLVAQLDSGQVEMKGDVVNIFNDPDLNIKYQLTQAEIPLYTKSSVNLSGDGSIVGASVPYVLTGDFLINKATFFNEITDYAPKGGSDVKFLPQNKDKQIRSKLDLNLNFKADNPMRITNSMMDIGILGQLRVLGNPMSLRGEGRLYTTPNSSRVFFKNAEYTILSGDVIFNPKKSIANPDFDVKAQATISNYRIFPKAYGDLERFSFDLSSEPSLPRNSIFSLIAFGYTDEIQTSLTQSQQQNLTQVGVGSFVFDRFKISDILNKQFGLQINLGTVFEQSQRDSLLAGRSQDSNSNISSRTISATKIELKKRLDEALTLSVSSTMGGGIGQRQSMNLNYGLTKKVQIEGIYELKSNAEGEEDIIDKSIGADLKFRWTFK